MSITAIVHLPPSQDGVLACLTPLELARLAKSSRSLRLAVQGYVKSTFNAYNLLSRFLSYAEVPTFRSLQAQTGTLISGAAALNFFDRSHDGSDPLDIFVYFHHRRRVADWLAASGFSFVPTINQSPDLDYAVTQGIIEAIDRNPDPSAVCDVFLFQKVSCHLRSTIRMFVAFKSPAEAILRASCTCLLNVISYERAYCLYPRATLHERRSLLIHPSDEGWVREVSDIMRRGYEVVEVLGSAEFTLISPCASFILGWRWIDDSSTWVVDLDTSDVTPPPAPNPVSTARTHDPVAICGFSLRYNTDAQAHMEFTVVDGHSVEFAYALGDRDLLRRIEHAICAKSPTWDGIYWDEELREICKEAMQQECFATRGLQSLTHVSEL